MLYFVKNAKTLTNVESNINEVIITYTKYNSNVNIYEDRVDTFDVTPVGDWTEIISDKQPMRYEKFLETMVGDHDIKVLRRMCIVQLDNLLSYQNKPSSMIRIVNSIKILDPTFVPPYVNVRCKWQNKLLDDICRNNFCSVINSCKNNSRLKILFKVLQLIESQQLLSE